MSNTNSGASVGTNSDETGAIRLVSAERVIDAAPEIIFEFIADPAQQPRWDGNDNLADSAPGQRVTAVGQIFRTRLTADLMRDNHVVQFEEDRRIAWKPAAPRSSLRTALGVGT